MAVGWKKKGDQTSQRRDSMTSMELAREERKEREKKLKAREFAIEQTNIRAAELFKQVARVLIHEAPMDTRDDVEQRIKRWEFECRAVIRLAIEDMRNSCHARRYAWNSDWFASGKLQMGRKLQPSDKPKEGETRPGSRR